MLSRLAAASTLEKDFRNSGKKGSDKAAASEIGKLIAERAGKAGTRKSYSTAAAISFMVASKRWPIALARAV